MLKKILLLHLIILLFTFKVNAQESFFSEYTYEEVLVQAKALKKPFFIDFTASWCLPCKLMEETVFQDYEVKKYTQNYFIALQLNVDDFDAMILRSKYDISSLPCILFFDENGLLLGKEIGLQTGTNFLKILQKYSN
ncbi:MAG: thioredoxin family protein [Chitinophagales bacterium]|nr:thioredoxin family protein [Bacteroidota bacterium]MCB9256917.1 thioredoxin family protein [Chitinophagales bacterium]